MTVVGFPSPGALRWPDVSPALHPFDAAGVAAVLRELAPDPAVPLRPKSADHRDVHAWSRAVANPWLATVTAGLVSHYGAWAAGWRWARDEGDIGGGPVGAWCCASHSMEGDAEDTRQRIGAALVQWRGWIEDLAARFDRHALDTADSEARDLAWRRGAADVIGRVAESTGGGDTWYFTCELALTWFLTRWGIPAGEIGDLIEDAIGGRFESWHTPDSDTVDKVATDVAAVATALEAAGRDRP